MIDAHALVTGGSNGIGRAVCQHLLAAGYTVHNFDRRPSPEGHARLTDYAIDLTDRAACRALAERVAADHEISHFVSNAGISIAASVEESTFEGLHLLADVHLVAALNLTQALAAGMRGRRFGRIVYMSSRSVLGKRQRALYAAVKAGLIGFTRTFALELAAEGITVNAVAPGPILTELYMQGNTPEQRARQAAEVPAGRLGTVDDVARAVMFFLDPANSYITGQTLYVCGGSSVGRSD